jgi:putative transposase
MSRQPYPSDLTDAQWECIEPHVPKPKSGGRPASVSRREIVNAVLYLVREGITWRAMPHDFPPYRTVYHYFRLWRDDGTWQTIHDALRDEVRTAAGRAVSPSAAILDAQSVKTVEQPATCHGFDPGKKVKGRKRHLAVDTLGLLLVVVVTAADVGDRAGARLLAGGLVGRFARLLTLFADAGYSGQPLTDWLRSFGGWTLEIVRGLKDQQGFDVQPKRWIVERTFGWLNRYRRLSKDDEAHPETSAVMIIIAMTHLMVRRVRK